ncbi:MAG: tetratricopeptide repeat protein [Treponema sp.]|nr:tetratricopeptide repeat protein [Treponema sp.]
MRISKNLKLSFLFFSCLWIGGFSFLQSQEREFRPSGFSARLQAGITLYRESRWPEAVTELRAARAEAIGPRQITEALYWLALAELSTSDYESALRNMEELEYNAPDDGRRTDIAYHRGRAYYYLGYYDEAIPWFKEYVDRSSDEARKSAALYWIGECLLALGQLDRARDLFTLVVEDHPDSAKFEAASYRLDIIKQRKVERELLALLKASHEESLRSVEDFQRKERTYDQAMNAYQKRLAESVNNPRLAEMESTNENYRQRLEEAGERIKNLEALLAALRNENYPSDQAGGGAVSEAPTEGTYDSLHGRALRLRDEMQRDLDELGTTSGGNE